MIIKLKVFGIFRDHLNDEMIIDVKNNTNLLFLKKYISNNILIDDLLFLIPILDKSNFSNDNIILSLNYILKANDIIFILPPFSGG